MAQGKTVAQLTLDSIDLRSGTSFVLVPRALNPIKILEFELGHSNTDALAPDRSESSNRVSPIEDASDELVGLIHRFLKGSEDMCIIENSLARAGDPWLQHAKSHIVTSGAEVYHLLYGADHTDVEILEAIRDARRFPTFLGFIGRLPRDVAKLMWNSKVATGESLEIFVDSTLCVFAGAYDGEGYVVWANQNLTGRVAKP